MKICEAGRDPCGCNNWSKGIRTIDGQYPDDNREFKIVEGAGILITPVTAGIKITNASNALIEGDNIKLTPNGDEMIISTTDDIHVNGDLNVDGDIIQQGASYETHMEQVYTTDDYITMRDGAVSALGSGQYAGFQVKKYDGTNDGRLVIDNTGTARVGDIGDEQPLLTRSESGSLTNGQLFKWDSANSKAVGVNIDAAPTDGSSNPVSSDGVYDALATKQDILSATTNSGTVRITRYGALVIIDVHNYSGATTNGNYQLGTVPTALQYCNGYTANSSGVIGGQLYVSRADNQLGYNHSGGNLGALFGSVVYITTDP